MRATLALLQLLAAPLAAQQPPPKFLYIYRDSLRLGSDSTYRVIEDGAARVCADLKCPNPYLGLESLSGPHEAWWLNAFATEADTTRVVRAYAANQALMAALGAVAKRKAALVGTPVSAYGVYRADLSRVPVWNGAGARFFVVTVTKSTRAAQGSVFEVPDGTLYVLRPVATRRDAQRLAAAAGPDTRVFAVRPNWSMPAPEWIAADPEFWRSRQGPAGRGNGPPMKMEFRTTLPKDADAATRSQPADWLTDGGNPRRTAWQPEEMILTPRNARDITLLWKITLDNAPREMHSLLPALLVGRAATREGPKQIVVVTGVSDNLYAIDAERGVVLWTKRFAHSAVGDTVPRAGLMCPGGITATPVIGPATAAGRYTIYAASWDGMLHQLNVADGADVAPPAKFMPPNGKPYALNLWKNVIYTHTAQGCGGHPNMAYAYDLATARVGSWGPAGGGMWGRTGPAINSKGVMYTGTGDGPWDPERGLYGNGIIGLQQNPTTKALELVDYYAPSNAEWLFKRDLDLQVTPAIFDYKGRELMVAGGKECRAYLMDTESIGGDDHRTPLFRTPLVCNEGVNFASAGIWGAMASWADSNGTRWVLAPFWGPKHSAFTAPREHGAVTYGAIAAFTVEERNGTLQLIPAWISRDMNRAEPPVVANGVVFAYGSGESTTQATPELGLRANQADYRIQHSTHAVLYALDGQTGDALWSSGTQITSWNHWAGLSVANGRVYLGTFDGTLYCFGIEP